MSYHLHSQVRIFTSLSQFLLKMETLSYSTLNKSQKRLIILNFRKFLIWTFLMTRENFKRVSIKHTKSEILKWSLVLMNKKTKIMLLMPKILSNNSRAAKSNLSLTHWKPFWKSKDSDSVLSNHSSFKISVSSNHISIISSHWPGLTKLLSSTFQKTKSETLNSYWK